LTNAKQKMSNKELTYRELKRLWVIDAISSIKRNHDHTQKEIAKNIGYSNANLISQIKKGDTNAPEAFIKALAKYYHLDLPKLSYSLTKNKPNIVAEDSKELSSSGNPAKELDRLQETLNHYISDLRKNLEDLRRENKGAYEHIETLRELINKHKNGD